MSNLTLEDIVQKTPDLPTIPAAALAVMRETESATGSANSVAHHLATDQALTARVLRLSNSAYYGLQRQVMDLQEAVVVLGMRSVRNLAMVAATYPWLSKPLKGYGLGPQEMWTHAFGVAVGAQLLAKKARLKDTDSMFTAGLVHNMGKVALSIWLENKIHAMLALATRDNLTFDQVEKKLLGYDHAEVGAYMADRWNLPKPLIEAIQYHHEPNSCPEPNLIVDCVHVADFLTMSMGYGLGGDGLRYDFQEEALQRIGLEASAFDEIAAEFIEAVEAYEKLFLEMAEAA
ncbi:MAG: HDOD domain-containing protein [Fimbriimonadaceae bacterium]